MFVKYEVPLTCMLVMQIKMCVNLCFSHRSHMHNLLVSSSQHMYAYSCTCVCVGRCVLYLAQGAFLHSDVSQQAD